MHTLLHYFPGSEHFQTPLSSLVVTETILQMENLGSSPSRSASSPPAEVFPEQDTQVLQAPGLLARLTLTSDLSVEGAGEEAKRWPFRVE